MKIEIDKKSPTPLYMQVKEQIQNYVVNNDIEEGVSLPDMATLSRKAGVSLKTTDRALNELIREGVLYRRPKKGTFVGSKKEFTHKHRICGIYHEAHVNSVETDVVEHIIYGGIQDSARQQKMDLFFITGDPDTSISRYRQSADLDLIGVIMFRWHNLEEGFRLAEKFPQVRFVYANLYLNEIEVMPDNVYGIFNDEFAGAYQMTDYLIQKGHKRIALVSLDLVEENYRQRIAGYRKALEDNGMPIIDDLIWLKPSGDGFHHMELGCDFAQEYLGRQNQSRPTAVFCTNDIVASGLVKTLRQAGQSGDVEVTGYDNIMPMLSLEYGFSTVAIDFKKMGQRAITILCDSQTRYPKILRVAPQLLIRGDYRKE